ncbi:UDP-N-acetylmuramoyl-L-alanyl-D-glutamate--2,6-diaminopimelate ligase [Brockia lithotrophica]|uniref:UDP-N-acetylmuramoyl-L-alanyl-D-glutamate--2,6-diaminopimelate ligase n=1 Tax=Brockia lithotrophica TaxID=933949 RepID=A0A660L6M1_9BACL|nr:UDP-N-acetylmuramoyl-L-alanyl-D-glutamate--2,6-diaminopimelate ligase [Brockia lithotrophica]RKQ88482.1 UDP-N-acetylmuramoylalanyl-D-glutamate--2,6-diaminopimelate ligase [Brockia lithotrophica]
MRLAELLAPLRVWRARGFLTVNVTHITDDSREVLPGSLFVARRGTTGDGHAFIPDALARGAVALVVAMGRGEEVVRRGGVPEGVPIVEVPDPHQALAFLAARLYGDPTSHLRVVGVTGTNGKSTVAYLVQQLLEAAGIRTGLVGTVFVDVGRGPRPAQLTTPGAAELQRLFRDMRIHGLEAAVFEASSHALDQGRIRGVRLTAAVFTNLTQDHLDYHATMDAYAEAKGLLFAFLGSEASAEKAAIVRGDDPHAERMLRRSAVPVYTYGFGPENALRAVDVHLNAQGATFVLEAYTGERLPARLPLLGRFNVENALAALAAAHALGVPLKELVPILEYVRPVPGRMERVEAGQPFTVLVDYAHTPDGLEKALGAVREWAEGRVIVVFGAGGDRDRAKRPRMGEVAHRLADVLVVTSDNPRSEDPEAIARDILSGIPDPPERETYVELDRKRAIRAAIRLARPGDVVLIAGKGHEREQIVGRLRIPFDDREEALAALRELGGAEDA